MPDERIGHEEGVAHREGIGGEIAHEREVDTARVAQWRDSRGVVALDGTI